VTTTNLDDVKKAMRESLSSGAVRTFIGWEQGSNSFRARPAFFRNPDEADGAIFSPACSPCLVRMVIEDLHYPLDGPDDRRPLGIILRGCDDKGIIELIKDRRICREDVVIIGVDCPGVVDWKKARGHLENEGISYDDLVNGELIWKDRKVALKTSEKEINFNPEKILMSKCLECEGHTPRIYNVLIGEEDKSRTLAPHPKAVLDIEERTPDEKWEFWEDVFSRCIRCFACRNICTYCYCEECAVDPTTLAISEDTSAAEKANRPEWVGRDSTVPSNAVYLMLRAYHGSGRCINCEECDRACPMGLSLRLLNRKVRKDAKTLFNYEAGNRVEDPPLFSHYCDTDPGDFIW